jgi:hypothetical protein
MDKKRLILAVVLMVIAIFSLIRGVTHRPGGRTGPGISGSGVGVSAADMGINTKRRAARSKFDSWRRGPFVPKGSTVASSLALNGIVWDKSKPKAMIGDMIVGRGDKIGPNTVVDIMKDRVVLNDGTRDFELKLSQ